mmetsp:Transcript_13887/g.26153  ORF Transcript_13887/g.26153 Transcript_13887/m.26153 type:complete len:701 (+) Transcript_13887:43-2145(+)|eukprot:CAMPEP_0176488316 /NCGR_PEP_ID=MMETSP0200_2-20121128/6638_1 /TAXON_ID=947934 /ORGANISM="Chaetoceros sp., Strain GSL56" /LENGTH=700 /DNA_ID=CAMNT_0017885279 /DNA_START=9 /DNA_END=2111 /DNA_ORIENTATION=+
MARRLLFDKKILLSIGFIGFWFCCMTLYFVTRISSFVSQEEQDQAQAAQVVPSMNGVLVHTVRGGILQKSSSLKFSSLAAAGNGQQHLLRDERNAAHVDHVGYSNKYNQVPFLTDQSNDAIDRTPFPQSIQNEKWETILHPAVIMRPTQNHTHNDTASLVVAVVQENDPRSHLLVPPFWNPSHLKTDIRSLLGNYGERLITPYEASLIGSRIPSQKNYDVLVGDAEEELIYDDENRHRRHVNHINYVVDELPPENRTMLETIYVSISSYRDYRCTHTVEMLFGQAAHPERIRVGVVDQLDLEEDERCIKTSHLKKSCEEDPEQVMCKYAHQMDVYEMDANLAVGPVLARHIGHRMYRGEYFAMQTDAHMEFVNDWDVDVIEQWRSAKNEMAVLTTYVSAVEKHYNQETGERDSTSRPYMCQTDFESDYDNPELTFLMHGQQPEGEPSIVGEPLLIPFWAAGFSFGRGHFVVQVPYDQYLPMIFQGEEISIGIRGFTYGYDFYAPEKSVLYHYYHTDPNHKKRKVKRFWEHAANYKGVEKVSKARLLGILQMFGSPVLKNTNTTDEEGEEEEEEEEREEEKGEEEEVNSQREHVNRKLLKKQEEEEEEENEYEVRDFAWVAIDEKLYGTGKVRTVQKFLDTFGIDLKEMTVQKHLCRFVDAPMTKMFTKAMRSDKMGIDYDRITYQFKDPKKYGNTWEEYL